MADDPKPVDPTPEANPEPKDKGREPSAYELELRKENEKLRKKFEAKLKEEEDARNKALEEQGKYKELYDKLKTDTDPLKAELDGYRANIKAERDALLAKMPEEKRAIYQDASIAVLRDVTAQEKTPTGIPRGTRPLDERKWDELSGEEQTKLQAEDPASYRRVYSEYYKRKNGIDPPWFR